MKTYLVTWEIDIEADSPLAAAQRALEMQRNPESIATQFYVQEHGKDKRTSIDFLELEESENQREWMDAEEAKSIKEGDKLEMLISGQGEGNEIGVTSYFSPGAVVEVFSVDYLARSGLSIGVQADNGVANFFDALDYGGKYPFKRI